MKINGAEIAPASPPPVLTGIDRVFDTVHGQHTALRSSVTFLSRCILKGLRYDTPKGRATIRDNIANARRALIDIRTRLDRFEAIVDNAERKLKEASR